MKINYFFILTILAVTSMAQASQVEQKCTSEIQREATPLEITMINEAYEGTLTQAKLQQYLDAGADINATHKYGETALILATNNLNTKIMQQLIAAGADINAKDGNGYTALMYAASNDTTKIDVSKITQQLIVAGADINAKNKGGSTALIFAASNRNTAIAQQLIAAGADINAKNINGDTALIAATHKGHTAIIQQLIAAGADDTIMNNANKMARDYAKDKNAYDKAVAAGLTERKRILSKKKND